MIAGIDYTRDGRTNRPARVREESGDCRNRKPAGLQGRKRRMGSRVQGCCHRWRLEPHWTCLATPGARELAQLQRRGEEVLVSPFLPPPSTHLAVPPFSSLGKATTGVRPFDSEQGRERTRNIPEENRIYTVITPQRYPLSSCGHSRILHTSILQPQAIVRGCKVSAADISEF